MTKKYKGIVRGTTIELSESPGLADGQQVQVELEAETQSSWGEGIKRSAGVLADDDEFAAAMEQIQRDRKTDSRPVAEL